MSWALDGPPQSGALSRLSELQRARLDEWMPGLVVERDLSWELALTTVLQVSYGGSLFVVKAAGEADTHIAREVEGHTRWLGPWTSIGRASRLVHADEAAKLLVTEYLPGELVQGHAAENVPDTYRQAGELLTLLHGQEGTVVDADYEALGNARTLAWLDKPHRIAPETVGRLRDEIASWPTPPTTLVPTHGDYHPRNWITHEGTVGIIDFGRAALRPAMSDFARLAAKEFLRDPTLEAAFLAGYGADPREPGAWYRIRVREAVGTAAWAYQVGDEPFEEQGHRMIAEVLAE